MIEKLNLMFGFILTQPIHKTLRQMRIATICLLIVSIDLMYHLVHILERGNELSPSQATGAVAALATAIFATIWKGISNLAEPHKDDD